MAWDSSSPTGATLISTSAGILQGNFSAIETGDVTSAQKVRIDSRDALSLSSDPGNVADVGYIYSKDVNSKTELHYIDEDGNVTQITNVGNVYSPIVQQVETSDVTSATSTTRLPGDSSIPQNTEGDEFATLAITPKSSTSKLVIEFYVPYVTNDADGTACAIALFQDSTAAALTATIQFPSTADRTHGSSLRYVMTSGTTSSTTFKIRFGPTGLSGSAYLNKNSALRVFGGVEQWNFTITEMQ
jgi:hypothetical protein